MKQLVNSPDFKASDQWSYKFRKRYGITRQRKTNKKSKSIEERLHLVKNFHWWTIYKMAKE